MLSNLSDIGSYHLLKIEQLKENKKWASSHYLYFPHCLTMLHKMNGNARLNTTINQIRWDITPSKKIGIKLSSNLYHLQRMFLLTTKFHKDLKKGFREVAQTRTGHKNN